MRGFRNAPGVSGHQFATNILILLTLGAVLFGSGCSGMVSASAGGNPGPLTISNVATTNATATGVAVSWQTNNAASSQVEYGSTASYGSTSPMDATMVTSHQETLGSLKPATLYHYRVHSADAANTAAVSNDLTFTTAADTTAPTVSITSPVANAALSGIVSLMASASDNVAVANVQFKVDNANTGTAITAAPFTYALNTATLSDGNHILTAVATDTSGNAATSAGVPVKVNNATPAPSIASLNPTSGSVGTSVTISGANFGATQTTSTVTFNGIAATPTSWSAASISTTVPAGATTGNVVVTVGGVASNGVSFTVQADTTAPVVTITAPVNNATVSSTITLAATASDPDSAVSFVQFLVDGTNTGAQLTAAPYSLPLDTTTLANGTHTLTAAAQDPAGNKGTSAAVTITVSNSMGTGATGPLRALASNPRYFTDGSGKAILLSGSHTWNNFMDMGNSGATVATDFNAYVNFLKAHGHSVTILWHKDLPTLCGWAAGGTWLQAPPFQWQRSGPGNANDGQPKFDLTKFDQAFFDRLRARAVQLQQNGIYTIVQLFDGRSLVSYRCGGSSDGYPLSGANNINGIDDGGGVGSMTMGAPNAITAIQDAYVQKVIDTLNDLPNVLWEISEEAPAGSTWWQGHIISVIHSYEAGKPFQHPVGWPTLDTWTTANDPTLYNSNADWVAPFALVSPTSSCGTGMPACKVNINDSDHSYFPMWGDSAQANRQYLWKNFTNGNSVIFMDPYLVFAGASNGSWTNRNNCDNNVAPAHGVCSVPDARWDNFRNNMGYTVSYGKRMDLAKMTPQGSLSSTGYCLAQTPSIGAEYLVYAPNGGSFTVDLTAMPGSRSLNVEWLDPSTGTTSAGGAVAGGATRTFTSLFGGDAVLYLVDAAGHS